MPNFHENCLKLLKNNYCITNLDTLQLVVADNQGGKPGVNIIQLFFFVNDAPAKIS